MRLIGRDGQQAIDRTWQQATGLPLILLMEAAAAAVCRVCLQLLRQEAKTEGSLACEPGSPGHAVLVLAGTGQNGGDAYACARLLLAAGVPVVCRELSRAADGAEPSALPQEAAANRRALLSLGLELGEVKDNDFALLQSGDLIVDGLFGTGFRADRPLPSPVAVISERAAVARTRGVRVVAIDVPSGLDADSGCLAAGVIQADYTVTFIRPKIGLAAAPGRFLAGQVMVETIGVADKLVDKALAEVDAAGKRAPCYQIDPAYIVACCPERPADSHKGLFGKVLLLGGSPGMPGAILLAAEAAARSGAGLTSIGVPDVIAPLVLAAQPESLLSSLPGETASPGELRAAIARISAGQTAVAIGPGAGQAAWLAEALPLLIRQAPNLVIDADALNHISSHLADYLPLLLERAGQPGLSPAILTPHPGEFRRLAPDLPLADRQQAAAGLAARCGCVVVLKGASTVVAEPSGITRINPTGHDGLARGGSGDVLCGLIAGLLGQGLTPAEAASAGVYLHGLAAELAAARLSRRAMLPGDVTASFSDAFRAAGWEERSTTERGSSIS